MAEITIKDTMVKNRRLQAKLAEGNRFFNALKKADKDHLLDLLQKEQDLTQEEENIVQNPDYVPTIIKILEKKRKDLRINKVLIQYAARNPVALVDIYNSLKLRRLLPNTDENTSPIQKQQTALNNFLDQANAAKFIAIKLSTAKHADTYFNYLSLPTKAKLIDDSYGPNAAKQGIEVFHWSSIYVINKYFRNEIKGTFSKVLENIRSNQAELNPLQQQLKAHLLATDAKGLRVRNELLNNKNLVKELLQVKGRREFKHPHSYTLARLSVNSTTGIANFINKYWSNIYLRGPELVDLIAHIESSGSIPADNYQKIFNHGWRFLGNNLGSNFRKAMHELINSNNLENNPAVLAKISAILSNPTLRNKLELEKKPALLEKLKNLSHIGIYKILASDAKFEKFMLADGEKFNFFQQLGVNHDAWINIALKDSTTPQHFMDYVLKQTTPDVFKEIIDTANPQQLSAFFTKYLEHLDIDVINRVLLLDAVRPILLEKLKIVQMLLNTDYKFNENEKELIKPVLSNPRELAALSIKNIESLLQQGFFEILVLATQNKDIKLPADNIIQNLASENFDVFINKITDEQGNMAPKLKNIVKELLTDNSLLTKFLASEKANVILRDQDFIAVVAKQGATAFNVLVDSENSWLKNALAQYYQTNQESFNLFITESCKHENEGQFQKLLLSSEQPIKDLVMVVIQDSALFTTRVAQQASQDNIRANPELYIACVKQTADLSIEAIENMLLGTDSSRRFMLSQLNNKESSAKLEIVTNLLIRGKIAAIAENEAIFSILWNPVTNAYSLNAELITYLLHIPNAKSALLADSKICQKLLSYNFDFSIEDKHPIRHLWEKESELANLSTQDIKKLIDKGFTEISIAISKYPAIFLKLYSENTELITLTDQQIWELFRRCSEDQKLIMLAQADLARIVIEQVENLDSNTVQGKKLLELVIDACLKALENNASYATEKLTVIVNLILTKGSTEHLERLLNTNQSIVPLISKAFEQNSPNEESMFSLLSKQNPSTLITILENAELRQVSYPTEVNEVFLKTINNQQVANWIVNHPQESGLQKLGFETLTPILVKAPVLLKAAAKGDNEKPSLLATYLKLRATEKVTIEQKLLQKNEKRILSSFINKFDGEEYQHLKDLLCGKQPVQQSPSRSGASQFGGRKSPPPTILQDDKAASHAFTLQ